MKRILFLLIPVIFAINLITTSVFAQGIPNPIDIKVDRTKGEVKIEGKVAQGPWIEVTTTVVNPSGGVDFIGQTTSGSEGAFDFYYTMKNEPQGGKYLIFIGGSHTDNPQKAYFDFIAPGEVKDIELTVGDSSLDIRWDNPVDDDLAGVNIYMDEKFVIFADKGDITFKKSGLTNGNTYTLTVKAVDMYGNESEGVSISGTPEAPANGSQPGTLPTPTVPVASKDFLERINKAIEEISKTQTSVGAAIEIMESIIKDMSENENKEVNVEVARLLKSIILKASCLTEEDTEKTEVGEGIEIRVKNDAIIEKMDERAQVLERIKSSLKLAKMSNIVFEDGGNVNIQINNSHKAQVSVGLSLESYKLLEDNDLNLAIGTGNITLCIPYSNMDIIETSDLKLNAIIKITSHKISDELEYKNLYIDKDLNTITDIYEISAYLEDGTNVKEIKKFKNKVMVEWNYLGVEKSIKDSSKVGMYHFNHQSKSWDYCKSWIDRGNKKVMFSAEDPGIYALMESNKTFEDIKGHWAKSNIEVLAARRIIKGVTENLFEPEREISRAEFTALIARTLGLEAIKYDNAFIDVSSKMWFAEDVQAAIEAGLISGYNGKFRPSDSITREEIGVIIVRAYEMLYGDTGDYEDVSRFTDMDEISPWALESAKKAGSFGLIFGIGDLRFEPALNATRAQSAAIICRLVDIMENSENSILQNNNGI